MRGRPFLGPLSLAAFAVIYSGAVLAPLVAQVAADFAISPGSVGIAAAAYGLPGIIVGAVAGPHADRHGRKRFLLVGCLVTGGFTLAASAAPTYAALVALRALAGLGAALILPNMMAAVADRYAYRERGRPVAIVFAANTLGVIAGTTVAGIVAERIGWRGSLAFAGGISLASAVALIPVALPTATRAASAGVLGFYRAVLGDRSALAILGSNLLGVAAWITWGTYIVAFFQVTYGVALGAASAYAVVQGLGMLVGSQIGGRVGDRLGQKLVLAGALTCYGAFVAVVTAARLPIEAAVALSFAGAVFFGMRATSNAALMTEQVVSARATVLALSAATVSAGTVLGTSVGGALLDGRGFAALGLFCFGAAGASAAIVAALVREGEQPPVGVAAATSGRNDLRFRSAAAQESAPPR